MLLHFVFRCSTLAKTDCGGAMIKQCYGWWMNDVSFCLSFISTICTTTNFTTTSAHVNVFHFPRS